MHGKRFGTDDTAVSEVLGVVLMVAITVLLAATAGVFVIGLGEDNQEETPQTAIGFDYDATNTDDTVTIVHKGGDTVTAGNIAVVVTGAEGQTASGNDIDGSARHAWHELDPDYDADDEIASGDRVNVSKESLSLADGSTDYDELDLTDATVKVVWESPDSASSFRLGAWDRGN